MALTNGQCEVVDDADLVVDNPEIDIVIELIGGYGIAKELVLKAIDNGKHVVTANKALIAVHGNEIFAGGAGEGRDGRLRGRRRRRHPDHQGAARRPDRQPHQVDRRHHQRHHQLHPHRNARQGAGLRRRAQGSAAPGLRRSRSDLRHRGHRRRAQADHHGVDRLRHSDAVRQGLHRRHHQAAGDRHPLRRAARLPHQAARHHAPHAETASSCACIRR